MYECKQCHIKIKGNIKCCPLCQSELHGTPEQNVFPVIHMQPPLSQKMFRMGLFITLVALAVCVGINLCACWKCLLLVFRQYCHEKMAQHT